MTESREPNIYQLITGKRHSVNAKPPDLKHRYARAVSNRLMWQDEVEG